MRRCPERVRGFREQAAGRIETTDSDGPLLRY
jgi:hypothetical protein